MTAERAAATIRRAIAVAHANPCVHPWAALRVVHVWCDEHAIPKAVQFRCEHCHMTPVKWLDGSLAIEYGPDAEGVG